MKKQIMLVTIIILLIGITRSSEAGSALKPIRIVTPRNAVFILSYFGARDAGIYRKHGIDLQIDTRPFKGFMASIPSREVLVTTYAGTAAIARIARGMDLVIIGGGLTVMQEVFVRKDSPYQSITDLRGKKFGIWSTGAGAAKALNAVMLDGFKINFKKDTEVVQAAPPALLALLKRGDIDSMVNLSSLTIGAASKPNQFRSIFSPNDYWKKKTGFPIVWSAPIVAWRDWIDEDPERAKNFVAATHESFEWLRIAKNADAAIKKYGKLAAVRTSAEAETYKKWLKGNRIFLSQWDSKVVDAQWKFLEVANRYGEIKSIPDKERHGLVLR
jgi:ABC-type nitrate/sulfonate/bicarbonate transport system substrate-binding protein